MFTDIYGYSAKMSRDENAALTLLKEHNRLLSEVIERHSGRVLKTMGDAYFAEFDAAFSAVACAVEIQTALKEYNQDRPAYDRIVIRIGLHIGDVIVDGEDLYGEGVNVAARLQPLAEPGGICMSQAVYQAVKSHTSLEAVHHGEVELKNIVEKYVVYKVPSFDPQQIEGVAKVVERRIVSDTTVEVERRAAPGVLNFKVKSVQKWPTVGRSRWLYIAKWTLIFLFAPFAMLLAISLLPETPRVGGFEYVIFGHQIDDPRGFVNNFRTPTDSLSVFLKSQFQFRVVRQIDEYDGVGYVSDNLLKAVCVAVSELIMSPNFWNIPGLYINSHTKALYEQALSDSVDSHSASEYNHQLFWSHYSRYLEDVTFLQSMVSQWIQNLESSQWWIFKFAKAILFMLFLFFVSSPTSLKITFPDLRDVDQGVSFLTSEMRFRRRRQDTRGILFRRWGFLGSIFKNLGGMRVRVEGNAIIFTSSNIVIQRAKKLFKLHLEA